MPNIVLASYRLDEIRERVCALGATLDHTQKKQQVCDMSMGCAIVCTHPCNNIAIPPLLSMKQRELERTRALKRCIEDQLEAVGDHIEAVRSMGGGWETHTRVNLDKCARAKATNISTFQRWHSVWPSLQVVLRADAEAPAAANALASLQGFVHEWVMLRTLACDIKVIDGDRDILYSLPVTICQEGLACVLVVYLCCCIHVFGDENHHCLCITSDPPPLFSSLANKALTETQSKSELKSADTTAQSFKMALSSLRDRANTCSSQALKDTMELKREVAALEKQRRQVRGIFLDLCYALEEDCSAAVVAAKETASASNQQLQAGCDDSTVQVNLSEGVAVTSLMDTGAVGTPEPLMVRLGTAVETRHQGGGGGAGALSSSAGPRPLDSAGRPKRPSSRSLTEKWLQSLDIPSTTALSKAIERSLTTSDPTVFNTGGKHHRRRSSKPDSRVPFEQGGAIPQHPTENEAWRRFSGEEVRAALVGLETRCSWRHLQLSAAQYIAKCLSSAEEQWFYMAGKNGPGREGGETVRQSPLLNGITISLSGEDGDIRHTYPLTRPGSVASHPSSREGHGAGEAGDVPGRTTEAISILLGGVQQYQRIMEFRRLVTQSVGECLWECCGCLIVRECAGLCFRHLLPCPPAADRSAGHEGGSWASGAAPAVNTCNEEGGAEANGGGTDQAV